MWQNGWERAARKWCKATWRPPDLVYVKTMTYNLACNWKVFNDNYLVRISQSRDLPL